MQTLKVASVIILVTIVISAAYLEIVVIPGLLADEIGNLAIALHIGAMAVLVGAGAYVTRKTIFGVFNELMQAHINSTVSTIGNLATGYWSADSAIQKGVFTTGAKLGFNMRDEVIEPDRNQIVNGVKGMQLPQTKQATGQSLDVVNEMDGYMDDLQERRNRLSQ